MMLDITAAITDIADYPIEIFLDPGIDARHVFSRTAFSTANHTNNEGSSVPLAHIFPKWTTAVSNTSIFAAKGLLPLIDSLIYK